MAITRVGAAQSISTNNGGGGSITFGTAPSVDDYIFIVGGCGTVTNGAAYGPSTAGYTLAVGSNSTGGSSAGLWYKKSAGSDPSVAFNGTGNAADSSGYIAMILRGVDPTNPFDTTPAFALVLDGPGPIVPVTAGCMALLGGVISNNVAPTLAPSGMTLWTTRTGLDTNKIGIGVAYQDSIPTGSYNTGSWTWVQTTPKRGILAAIKPYIAVVPPTTPFEGWGVPV